MFNWLARANC